MFWNKKKSVSDYELVEQSTEYRKAMDALTFEIPSCDDILTSRGFSNYTIQAIGRVWSVDPFGRLICTSDSASEFKNYVTQYVDDYYNNIYTHKKKNKFGVRKKSIGWK